MRLLIVEDNPAFASVLQRGLRQHGYVTDVVATGADGEDYARAGDYDIILMDVKLPDRDGREVCRNLRSHGIRTKILMLSALGTKDDTVEGLDAGADDYLAKPFEFDELFARIRSLLRRGTAGESGVLRYADLELDLRTRTARRGSVTVSLPLKEHMVLEAFMRRPQEVLSRDYIAEKIYSDGVGPRSNVIDVYIGSLRNHLDRGFDRRLIHTVTGVGYRLGDEQPTEKVRGSAETTSVSSRPSDAGS